MKKYKVGYTQGVYDMFHIGHLNLLNHAKEYCDYLIVGINSDKLVEEYKKKHTVINEQERALIVSNIKAVDEVLIVDSLDKKTVSRAMTPYSFGERILANTIDIIKLIPCAPVLSANLQIRFDTVLFFNSLLLLIYAISPLLHFLQQL